MGSRWLSLLCACAAALAWLPAGAAAPVISIIIDDLGDRRDEGARVIGLPGPVACAILPNTPHGVQQALDAHAHGKEVLLHFPLEPKAGGGRAHPLAVTTRSSREELVSKLRDDLDSLPFVNGVNIHQGSLLSQRTDYMNWMMAELRARGGLYFVDSFTSAQSVAWPVAEAWELAATRRQVFLDDVRDPEEIRAQLVRLIAKAQREGSALAIGHPYPETIAVLERELPALARYQVRLVAPSELIRIQQGVRPAPRNRPLQLKFTQTFALSTIATAPLTRASH